MSRLQLPPLSAFHLVTAITIFSASVTQVHGAPPSTIHPGQVLTPSDGQYLISSGNIFSFGFRNVSQDRWYLSIWYANLDRTIVWMANRDIPVTQRASLNFTADGELVLLDPSIASPIWSTGTAGLHVLAAEVQDRGNFVLLNASGGSAWESFDSPTDTLLPEQPLKTNAQLVSGKSAVSYASGRYRLVFTPVPGSFAKLENVETGDQYWRVGNTDESVTLSSTFPPGAQLEQSGAFCFNRSSGDRIKCFTSSDVGASGIIRRVKLDVDGNLRTYSWDESTRSWTMVWIAIYDQCSIIPALCGQYGVCVYDPAPVCVCPPGFKAADENDISQGCSRNVPLACRSGGSRYVVLDRTDYPYNDYDFVEGVSIAECLGMCSGNCSCVGAAYSMVGDGRCWTKSKILNGHGQETGYARFFLKIGESSVVNPPVEQGATKWGSDDFWQQQASASFVGGPH